MYDFDVLIKNGLVVDGTGSAPRPADVGVRDGRVTALDLNLRGSAGRTIDASDRIVTPGFFDPHTHLDAQIAWDPMASPLHLHGVTSVVMGNCGVTFAPCGPDSAQSLAEMMEAVEEVPADVVLSSLPWNWQGYDGYLEFVRRTPKALNFGGLVGHSAIRAYVMGVEASLDPDRAPTENELNRMSAEVHRALTGGALGVSTSRTLRHSLPDGRAIPGTFAEPTELLSLCDPMRELGRGVFEVSPRLTDKEDYHEWPTRVAAEMKLMLDISQRSGRPLTFSLFNHRDRAEVYRAVLEATTQSNLSGGQLRPQIAARRVAELHGLAQNPPFTGPAWRRLAELDPASRLAALEDEAWRDALILDVSDGQSTPPADQYFLLGYDSANYEYGPGDTLASISREAGETPVETFIRCARESGGRAVWIRNFLNHLVDGLEAMITHPDSVLGLGDTGAHVGGICDSSLTTYVLKYWVRDRQVLSLADGVRKLTSEPAALFGQPDRGLIRVGLSADLNVIDLQSLDIAIPEYSRHLPGGAGMWIQAAKGYDCTLVNGAILTENGRYCGNSAGVLLT
jgi:N-acyl-D-amino-acid deacylase